MSLISRSLLLASLTFGAAAFVPLGGCERSKPQLDGQPLPKTEKAYRPGADGLRELWADILEAARKDDRERVHELMASTIMSDADLVALFGDERARYLKPRYLPMIAQLVNVGALELVA